MRKVRNILTTATLASLLLFGTTFANAGIIVAGLADRQEVDQCTVNKDTTTKVDSGIIVTDLDGTGIIVAGFTGIIVAGFTGIIVAGATAEPVDCGIIVAG